MAVELNVKAWEEVFRGDLPGGKAHARMSPAFRGAYLHDKDPSLAAVMALIYPDRGKLHTVFIKRNNYDGPHSAQVSFPGGALEADDPSLMHAAIRETREELGITGDIHVIGSLTPLHIPVSNFLVSPFAGILDSKPVFSPDPSEVSYVIEASLEHLLDPGNIQWDHWDHHNTRIKAPYYKVGKEKIWGATAMMLSEFLQLVSRLP